MRRYKLKCFGCSKNFSNKNNVFRDRNGWPVCEECMQEDVDWDYNEPSMVFQQIKHDFNRDIRKYEKYIRKECEVCEKCGFAYPKDNLIDNICDNCSDYE